MRRCKQRRNKTAKHIFSPYLNRFIQPDTIIPSPSNPQAFNRYSYVYGNPVRYIDPTGHGTECGFGESCVVDPYTNPILSIKKVNNTGNATGGGSGGNPGGDCSISSGAFNGNFTCTVDDLNNATIEQRQKWFNEMLASVNPAYISEFKNINGILRIFILTGNGDPGSWISWGDAGILWSIQAGLAMSIDEAKHTQYASGENALANHAANAWKEYFNGYKPGSNNTFKAWGNAEGLGTSYGRYLAMEHGASKDPGEMMFLFVGDIYRNGLKNGQGDRGSLYSWFFDTRAVIPGTNYAPVEIPAFVFLH